MRKGRSPKAPAPGGKPDADLLHSQHPGSKKKPRGRPWPKGTSGNPCGRRPGTISPTMALRRALTRQEADALAAKVVAMAKAGDATCLRLLFDRLDGPSSGPIAAIALATVTAQQAQAEHDPFAGWTSKQLRDILAGLQQEGATIRKEGWSSVEGQRNTFAPCSRYWG